MDCIASNYMNTTLKGCVTLFNILTISTVGIGIGVKMLKTYFFDLKKSQKIIFFLSGLKFYSVWGSCQPKFTPFLCPQQPNFTPLLGPRQPNFTSFGCPQQLLIKPILPARPVPTRAVAGDPKME